MGKILNTNHLEKGENNSFITPENYFDTLPAKIINRCKAESKKNNNSIILQKPVVSIAASVIIIIGISLMALYFSNNKNDYSNDFSKSLSDNMLYIADKHEIDESNIIDYLAENNSGVNTSKYNNDDIIDYIDANTNNYNEVIELIEK